MAYRTQLNTALIAASGAVVFYLSNIPLPFLFGPMIFCLIAALLQFRLKGLGQISISARTVLGVAVGASITPELLTQIPAMAGSVLLIPVYNN